MEHGITEQRSLSSAVRTAREHIAAGVYVSDSLDDDLRAWLIARHLAGLREVEKQCRENERLRLEVLRLRRGLKKHGALGLSIVPGTQPLCAITGEFLDACNCWKGRDCLAPGKHPILRRRHLLGPLTADPMLAEYLAAMAQGYGVFNHDLLCGSPSRVIVLDVDPRNGGTVESVAEAGWPLDTWRVISGGGGEHLYYRIPDDAGFVRNDSAYLTGVELKSDGLIVLLPPSLHYSGRRYAWRDGYRPDQVALREIPGTLLASLTLSRPDAPHPRPQLQRGKTACGGDRHTGKRPPRVQRPERPMTKAERSYLNFRARRKVERAIDRIRGNRDGGQHNTGLWLACQLRDLRVSDEQGRHYMLAYHEKAEALRHAYL